MVCTSYTDAFERAAAAGALTATSSGEPYLYRYGTDIDASFSVAQYDFFTEAGRTEYARVLDAALGDGYDGWMEDFGEYTPLDSVSAGEIPGTRAHNPYPTRYHCAAHEATSNAPRPIVRFQRSGWTGSAACATVVWGGDPTTSWGFDGLRSAVTQALSVGTSGVAIWGSDIGGFFALGPNRLTPELLTRWVQLGAVSPVMRTQANGVAVPRRDRPQVSDPDQIANWRRYTKLHTQLYPYLDAAVAEYRRTGMPVMRHLGLVYPRDSRAAEVEDEFLFGPDLLVAPVLDPEQVQRSAYLPRGRWIDLWRTAAYRETSGGLRLGKASLLRGRRDLTVPAPLTELPLFVRRGAVIAMLPARVDTLAGYGNGVEGIQTLAANRRRAELLAFPHGRSRAAFYSSETIRSIERRGRWRLRIAGKMRRRYDLQASMKTLRRPLRPCRLEVDGRELEPRRWRFERSTGVLRARFAGRRPTLTAIGC
jgi:alpha-glucosidase (family GH31 glycosyl hydrolase)